MFCPITPQKRSYHTLHHDENTLKELSPFPQCINQSSHRKNTNLQLLQSPMPTHRDLFSQLLASQLKNSHDTQPQYQTIEDDIFEEYDQISYNENQSDVESLEEIDEESSQENGIKKRKRKSTAQIKILKQELDVDANWSKDKIVEMSDITGLSQSQVYKWWWDQKKKNVKGEKESFSKILKRKIIHKDYQRRIGKREHEYHEKEESGYYAIEDTIVATKVKANIELQQLPETERKISKRLSFA